MHQCPEYNTASSIRLHNLGEPCQWPRNLIITISSDPLHTVNSRRSASLDWHGFAVIKFTNLASSPDLIQMSYPRFPIRNFGSRFKLLDHTEPLFISLLSFQHGIKRLVSSVESPKSQNSTTILAMNHFLVRVALLTSVFASYSRLFALQPGTRVLFFTARNEPVQGTVMDRGVGQDVRILSLLLCPGKLNTGLDRVLL